MENEVTALSAELGAQLAAKNEQAQSFWDKYLGQSVISKLLAAAVLLVLCIVFIKILMKITNRVLSRSKLEPTAHSFVRTVVRLVLVFIAIMLVAGTLGVDTSSLLAIFSIAGLAVSLSVQDALSNMVSAVMLLTAKPYKAGDYIEVGELQGTVREIGIIHTRLVTLDGKDIRIPNSQILSGNIINYSSEEKRRVVLTVRAGFEADTDSVKSALLRAAQDERILTDEPIFARVSNYGESWVEYTLRFQVRNADYWPVYYDVLENIKRAFDAAGINMPCPRVDVHNV